MNDTNGMDNYDKFCFLHFLNVIKYTKGKTYLPCMIIIDECWPPYQPFYFPDGCFTT